MENENQNNQEEISQEELAKQWEEALNQQEQEKAEEKSDAEQNNEEVSQEELAKQWEEALNQQAESSTSEEPSQEELAKQWEEALAQQQTESSKEASIEEALEDEKLDLLMDIPLEISVQIGSKTMLLEDVLKINPNSIIELDRYIDEPINIKINGKLVAKGQLYTVENNFGIKITSIITVRERMKLLMEGGD